MARVTDNFRILVNPCTPEDNSANWQQQDQINTTIINLLQEGGGGDTFKVGLNATDVANGTPDYLHAKIEQISGPSTSRMMPVRSETLLDLTEVFYVALEEIPGYNTVDNMTLMLLEGEPTFVDLGSFSDDKKVLVSGTDTVASFLHDALDLNEVYVGGADLLVASEVVGADATDQTERLFVDISAIAGWHSTELKVLALENNQVAWVTADFGGGSVGAGYAIDVSAGNVGFDPTEITGFAASMQFFMHTSDAAAATDPKWQSATNYSTSGGTSQVLINNAGTWTWWTGTQFIAKIPTSIELEIINSGAQLRVKLNYTEYTLFGTAGDSGSSTATVNISTC